MKFLIISIGFCLLSLIVNSQVKLDSSFFKVIETDEYSIYNKKGSNKVVQSNLLIKDKKTNTWISDTSKIDSGWETYNKLTDEADKLFFKNDCEKALGLYRLAFKLTGDQGKVRHRYNAACCYSFLNEKDLAFNELNRITTKSKYYNYLQITSEKKLQNLHSDERWKKIIEQVKENASKIEDELHEKMKTQ